MLPTSARLLRLLSLLQARRFWSGADLCERLEITERTLRRDVDRLRQLGYPVQSTSGVAGGYQLGAGATLPPLQLEDDEALAVSIALGTAAQSAVAGVDEAALRALVKLEQVLPSRLRRRADALRATIAAMPSSAPRIPAALLGVLASACRDHSELGFRYADAGGRESLRHTEPAGLVQAATRWYLVAWDRDRGDYRTFRVDRIQGTPQPGPRFSPRPAPEGGDLLAYVSRSLAVTPHELRASVILHAPYASIAARVPLWAVLLERIDEHRCRMQAGASSADQIAGWLIMLGVDFEVEEPETLRQHLRGLQARLGRAIRKRQPAPRTPR